MVIRLFFMLSITVSNVFVEENIGMVAKTWKQHECNGRTEKTSEITVTPA